MSYDFKPGEKIQLKNGGPIRYFVAEINGTVYVTREEPGFAVNADAYTDSEWERAPKPFFEVGKTYRFKLGSGRYTVHHIVEMGNKRFAIGLSKVGAEAIFNEDYFQDMEEA